MTELDKIRARAAEQHGHGDYASWDDIDYLLSLVDVFARHEAVLPSAMFYAMEDEPKFRDECVKAGCEVCPLVIAASPKTGGAE